MDFENECHLASVAKALGELEFNLEVFLALMWIWLMGERMPRMGRDKKMILIF